MWRVYESDQNCGHCKFLNLPAIVVVPLVPFGSPRHPMAATHAVKRVDLVRQGLIQKYSD